MKLAWYQSIDIELKRLLHNTIPLLCCYYSNLPISILFFLLSFCLSFLNCVVHYYDAWSKTFLYILVHSKIPAGKLLFNMEVMFQDISFLKTAESPCRLLVLGKFQIDTWLNFKNVLNACYIFAGITHLVAQPVIDRFQKKSWLFDVTSQWTSLLTGPFMSIGQPIQVLKADIQMPTRLVWISWCWANIWY